jgi:hypothetical protein
MKRSRSFVALVLLGATGCGQQPQVSSQVTPSNIRSISVGMTKAEVESILGPPLEERKGDNEGGILLDYAKAGLALRSFNCWVYLDSRGRVNTVRVTECPMIAERYAIYDARPTLPVYEHPNFARIVETQK